MLSPAFVVGLLVLGRVSGAIEFGANAGFGCRWVFVRVVAEAVGIVG